MRARLGPRCPRVILLLAGVLRPPHVAVRLASMLRGRHERTRRLSSMLHGRRWVHYSRAMRFVSRRGRRGRLRFQKGGEVARPRLPCGVIEGGTAGQSVAGGHARRCVLRSRAATIPSILSSMSIRSHHSELSSQCALITMRSHHNELSSQCALITMSSHHNELSSQRALINASSSS